MKWPWSKQAPSPTVDWEHVNQVLGVRLKEWQSDFGPMFDGLANAAGITRIEAMLYVLVVYEQGRWDAQERSIHPTVRAGCAHCEQQALMADYMRESLKVIKRENKEVGEDDKWNPIP